MKSLILVVMLSFLSWSTAQAQCLRNLEQLRAAKIKTTWVETTMDDGKPLIIVIHEANRQLEFSAAKAGELWLRGEICISLDGKTLTLKNIKATEAVPPLARRFLSKPQSGRIENNEVRFSGLGWNGIFVGQ